MTCRPWTPDYVSPDGMTHITVKRLCNGCGRPLGDITDAELGAAISGFRLPDVTGECGCVDGKAKGTPELAGAPECGCYPGGFTPDAFEGPQEHCRVHGRAES